MTLCPLSREFDPEMNLEKMWSIVEKMTNSMVVYDWIVTDVYQEKRNSEKNGSLKERRELC